MANPQKENGHIDIANEIAEALARTNLGKYENRYLWALWRKTYGWHKKEDIISNSQFVKITGIKKQHIWRTEQQLINRNIVTKTGNKIAFQKDYTRWRELPKQVTVTSIGIPVTSRGIKVTSRGGHKRNYTKETITKEILSAKADDFSFKDKLILLEESNKKKDNIIGLYWKIKGIIFENFEQYQAGFKRELKPAKELIGYELEILSKCMRWIDSQNYDFEWKLSTVAKKIDYFIKGIKN